MKSEKSSQLHKGHRRRLKKRYIDESGEEFCDHELIELLLFYCIPRKDTNTIAHELYERFGSVSGVANAGIDQLKLVDGIGDNAAVLLDLVMSFAKRIAAEQKVEKKRLDTLKKLVKYAESFMFGATNEQVYLVMMDSTLRVIDTKLIAVGHIDEVKPIIRRVLEFVVLKRASAIALTHNHPNGGIEASSVDVEFTALLQRELEVIGVRFIEHVIVDGNSYNAVMHGVLGDDVDIKLSLD